MTAEQVVSQDVPVRAAPAPVAAAGASRVAVVTALLLIAIGVVAMRDTAIAAGWLAGKRWVPVAAAAIDGLTPAAWMKPAAIAVALLGLGLVTVALAPRRRTAVELTAATSVYVRHADLAKAASARARDVPGVLEASSTSSRRKVVVRCQVTGDQTDDVRRQVADVVSDELDVLGRRPRVVVRARTVHDR